MKIYINSDDMLVLGELTLSKSFPITFKSRGTTVDFLGIDGDSIIGQPINMSIDVIETENGTRLTTVDTLWQSVKGFFDKASGDGGLYVAYASDANGTGFSLTATDSLRYRAEFF